MTSPKPPAELPVDPLRPDRHINPETGIWPMSEWGSECTRGLVTYSEQGVTKRKRGNRKKTRVAKRRFGGAGRDAK